MWPEEMERWGAATIFKESARLLHKHYRLFLPFFLAFYLPSSIAAVFQTLFLSSSTTPLLNTIVVKGFVNTAQVPTVPLSSHFEISSEFGNFLSLNSRIRKLFHVSRFRESINASIQVFGNFFKLQLMNSETFPCFNSGRSSAGTLLFFNS